MKILQIEISISFDVPLLSSSLLIVILEVLTEYVKQYVGMFAFCCLQKGAKRGFREERKKRSDLILFLLKA